MTASISLLLTLIIGTAWAQARIAHVMNAAKKLPANIGIERRLRPLLWAYITPAGLCALSYFVFSGALGYKGARKLMFFLFAAGLFFSAIWFCFMLKSQIVTVNRDIIKCKTLGKVTELPWDHVSKYEFTKNDLVISGDNNVTVRIPLHIKDVEIVLMFLRVLKKNCTAD